jgi:hypothetical protein
MVRLWWIRWPGANIALACERSGIVAADVDPRNGGDETWAALRAREGPFPPTWTNLTGGGGVHELYRAPEGFVCRSDSLGPGVDVKWHGYVLLPPSDHLSGRTYGWESGQSPFDGPAALLPPSLAARLSAVAADEDVPPHTGSSVLAELLSSYCPDGEGHPRLIRILGSLRTRVAQDEALAIVSAWNTVQCQPKPIPADVIAYQVADVYRRWPEAAAPVLEDEQHDAAAGEPPTPRFAPIAVKDLAEMVLPPVEWAYEDMIPQGAYVVTSGESGVGKSWWAAAHGLCTAMGLPWLGRTTRQCRVLYIDEENALDLAQMRIRALLRGLGLAGVDVPMEMLIWQGFKLGKIPDVGWLSGYIEKHDIGLLIADSWIRFFDGDENVSKEVAATNAKIDEIRRKTGVTWEMLHHLAKPPQGKGNDADTGNHRVRGSGDIIAHADVHIALRGGDGAKIVVQHKKSRWGEPVPDFVYELRGSAKRGEPVTFHVLGATAGALGAVQAAIMYACDVLEVAGTLTVGELVDLLGERHGIGRRTAEAAVARARESGAIVEDRREGRYVFLRVGGESEV